MNWDVVKGNWKQFMGKAKTKWGKLTDDDWKVVGGKKDEFLGKLQERYGYQRDQAEKEVDEFLRTMNQP
ncbi:MAG TPA: CsbD family protein [Gemmataceae bacterium]|nr:CsbD family protein [Gemmataceae bacterium]